MRLIPLANARASTGFPSLNLKVRFSVNVYVLPSAETFGGAAATSGTRLKDFGACLSDTSGAGWLGTSWDATTGAGIPGCEGWALP